MLQVLHTFDFFFCYLSSAVCEDGGAFFVTDIHIGVINTEVTTCNEFVIFPILKKLLQSHSEDGAARA